MEAACDVMTSMTGTLIAFMVIAKLHNKGYQALFFFRHIFTFYYEREVKKMNEKIKTNKLEGEVYESFLEQIISIEQLKGNRGSLLKCLRKIKGLSQSELANELGISFCTINRYETGKQRIPDIVWYGFLYYFGKEKENDK